MKKIILPFLFVFNICFGQIPSFLPTNGLAAWYPFNGNANDESGNGNNGTVYSASLTSDKSGTPNKAYNFAGNARIQITPGASLNTKIISINAWVNFSNTNLGMLVTRRKWSDASAEQYSFDTKAFYVKRNGACQAATGWSQLNYNNTPNTSTWAMLTVIYDGINMKYYLNGALNSSVNLSTYVNMDSCIGADIIFGATWSSFPFYYSGKLDDISIYNRALNASEIQMIYSECIPLISVQPANQSITETLNTGFKTKSLVAGVTYQWQQNSGISFINLTNTGSFNGTNSDSLQINNADISLNNTYYRCIISTGQGCKDTTNAVRLTVNKLILKNIPFYLPDSNLVAWYPFNGNAIDESGNGNNGIVLGATLTQDRVGNLLKSYSFNGTNARIKVPYSASLKTPYITVNVWIKPSNTNIAQIITKRNWQNASNEQYSIDNKDFYIKRNSNCITDQGWKTVNYTSSIPILSWSLLSVSYDGRYINYYRNGVLINSNDQSTYKEMDTCSGAELSFGACWANFPFWFNGNLDDISIYSRALSNNEIWQIYTQCRKVIINQPGDVSKGTGQNVQFITQSLIDSIAYFQWQLNDGSGFTNIQNSASYSGANTNTLNIVSTTQSMNNYKFRCLVSSPITCVDTSRIATLSVQGVGIYEALNDKLIEVVPNPNNGNFDIKCLLNEGSIEQVAIFDLSGKKLEKSYSVNKINQNEYHIDIYSESGIYILKLNSGVSTLYKKIVIY
ncbi:MAG: LamG-like jellyroll fold domain-containing protein [Bacteroidota bacterium]|nr:LamG-like jellyroll fold domain-containing protein [Bacteroidota bacterium]